MTVSFWDALIIDAAIAGGATTLYSEDLQDGLEIDGLTIRNPFR
jgi:predicted nucleic acid-binding protein